MGTAAFFLGIRITPWLSTVPSIDPLSSTEEDELLKEVFDDKEELLVLLLLATGLDSVVAAVVGAVEVAAGRDCFLRMAVVLLLLCPSSSIGSSQTE